MIVADAGFKHNDAAAAFAEFGGITAGLDAYGAESVGGNMQEKLPAGGLGDIEPIKSTTVW